MLIETCICGRPADGQASVIHDIPVRFCACGAIHQRVEMTPAEYADFYAEDYHTVHQHELGRPSYAERFEHDREVARQRLRAYGNLAGPLLDIGTGNGAFVVEARNADIEAYGQDLGEDSDPAFTYVGDLAEQHFPTGHFGTVTIHDVLEHVLDPVAFLAEVRRITADDGRLIVDFPAFHEPEGLHHWRPIQHLWMLRPHEVVELLRTAGFTVENIERPIPSKHVFEARPIAVARPQLLMLPGIGDIYWVMTRLRGFLEAKDLSLPDVHIWNFDGRPRSLDYVRRIPFVRAAGYFDHDTNDVPEFRPSYLEDAPAVYPGVLDFDYYLSANGALRNGRSIDHVLPYDADWFFPLFRSLRERAIERRYAAELGDYLAVFVSDLGMFSRWVGAWGSGGVIEFLRRVRTSTGYELVFTGCDWDRPFTDRIAAALPGSVNLCGETDLDQLFALFRSSRGVVGWCGGNTISAVHLRKPTFMVWSRYFPDPRFFTHCVPPESLSEWYDIATVEVDSPVRAADRCALLVGRPATVAA